MSYCKYCGGEVAGYTHECPKKGLLNVDEDDSFLTSVIIGAVTDSAILGGLLGGDIIGGIAGDLLDGDLLD